MDLPGSPTADGRAAVEQNLHQPDHTSVVDFDAGKLGGAYSDRQRETLQERELDVDIQALCLERGETIGNRQELLAHGGHMLQSLLQSEIGQIVGADLIAQEGGELFVLLDEGVFEVGAEDVMPVLDLLMPGMDGVEVLRQLRQREYTGGVIIITGSHDEERLDEAWAVGPQEVIGKPIDLEQLLTSIQLVLVCREC